VLAIVLCAACATRLWVLLTQTYIVFPDETFQYLEQGHRLAFGSGVVTWEYIDGIRSWLLPGAIAGVMRLVASIDPTPHAYVLAVRLCFVAASLGVPYVAFRIAERRFGFAGATVAGLLGALWYDLVYFAPVVMTESLATSLALCALLLGEPQAEPLAARRCLALGALMGLAVSLRYQYAPALAAAILCQHWRAPRTIAKIVAGAAVVVALAGGLLDWLTWGAPFQSVWLNFERNAVQQVSTAMGTEPWWYTPAYFLAAWGWLTPLLLPLALLGARQWPPLAVAAAATLALHALVPHKEVRFIYLAIAAMPILIGLGVAHLLAKMPALQPAPAIAAGLALLLAAGEAASAYAGATPRDAWHRDRSTVRAFYAAHGDPGLCGLGVRSLWVYRSGGYTFCTATCRSISRLSMPPSPCGIRHSDFVSKCCAMASPSRNIPMSRCSRRLRISTF
jgi:phosphatidylinositol glycan class B